MPVTPPHVDPATIDTTKTLVDHAGIYALIPHRHEMQMLTAIVCEWPEQKIIVGYKDVRDDEFWVRGHFPEKSVMPGVLMCEAAAQLTGFYTHRHKISRGVLIGLGGIDNSRFRRPVLPGERLLLIAKGLRVKPRVTLFNVQGFVDGDMAFETDIMGVVLARTGSGD